MVSKQAVWTFTGETDLWLSNGAVWKNHAYGNYMQSDWIWRECSTDRLVTNFQGGKTQEKSRSYFPADDNDLTIGNYSGFTNIYFAHNNDGSSTEDYDVGACDHPEEERQVLLLR